MTQKYQVAVIGAGPAGLYGARELAEAGVNVTLFNRDIKPGGLAEYGIYPDKVGMKNGLRKQFKKILETPNLRYFGNVSIGENADLSLSDLRALGFQAILVTTGAQGTKWLGLEGEDLKGVYHAKDVVYHYNHLPPFSLKDFRFGSRCLVVGAGNVMIDIARYLIREAKVDEVTALVRRGPAEVKFTKKELEYVAANIDLGLLDAEMQRVAENMRSVNQDPDEAQGFLLSALPKAQEKVSDTKFGFRFLCSPTAMHGEDGLLTHVDVEENLLALKNGDTKPRGTGEIVSLEAETIIFAIGDTVDDNFGLPTEWSEFIKNESPRFPQDEKTYEVADAADIFVAGWSRKASDGLVGYARKDGTNGARAVLSYLDGQDAGNPVDAAVDAKLASLSKPIVTGDAALRLYEAEKAEAEKRGVDEFKFDDNGEMLKVIGLETSLRTPQG
jgi:ferredoxin--NADP+ reductase